MWLWLPAKGIPMSKSLWNYLYLNVQTFPMVSKSTKRAYKKIHTKKIALWKLDFVEQDLKKALAKGDPIMIANEKNRCDYWHDEAYPNTRDDCSGNANAQGDREASEARKRKRAAWIEEALQTNQET